MPFSIVHELRDVQDPARGRIRIRAKIRHEPERIQALAQALAAVDGICLLNSSTRSQSILFTYETNAARQTALHIIVAHDDLPFSPKAATTDLVRKTTMAGLWPLARWLMIRPFLPVWWRTASSIVHALPYLFKGIKSLLSGRLNVDVLDAAALSTSIAMRDYSTVSIITLLLGLGDTLEQWTRQRSMACLAESLALNINEVWVKGRDGAEICIPFSKVQKDDLIIIRDGGSIPVDGVVADGMAMVNQSSMTGEPLAVKREKGDPVYAGTVVEEGRLVIRVSNVGSNTRLRQIAAFIEESEAHKAGIQGKSERMADIAVPFTFGLAGLVWLWTRNFQRVASVLLVDYSCALKLATPLAIVAAMHEGANHGIVIKGGRYIEALAEADTAVFDKTGTLTNASPEVVEVIAAPGFERNEVLRTMACLEEHFPHPIARAAVRKAQQESIDHKEGHTQVRYVVAHGIRSTLDGQKVRVGSRHYIEQDEGVDCSVLKNAIDEQVAQGRSILYLAQDNKLAGILSIADPLRHESVIVMDGLRRQGFGRIVMLTGDDERAARAVAREAGITEFRAQILPTDKARIVQELTGEGCRVMMVGDGINDSPALSAAHVGVAMCDGTDLAREVANIVLTDPTLYGLIVARHLSRSTMRRIKYNFGITLALNSVFLFGGLANLFTPALSAVLHNLTTLGISINAMRPHLRTRRTHADDESEAE